MRRLVLHLLVLLLAFAGGLAVKNLWEGRDRVVNACVDFAQDWQD